MKETLKTLAALAFMALLVVGTFATIVTLAQWDRPDREPTKAWNLYHGDLNTAEASYSVSIDEADKGHGFRRIVHLKPRGEEQTNRWLTGHDYNDDKSWDRVFYCGNHKMIGSEPGRDSSGWGCNSVIRDGEGWTFEPCPSDEGRITPFSEEAIAFAIGELDAAMHGVHNDAHVTARHEWSALQQKVIKVYDRNSPSSKDGG